MKSITIENEKYNIPDDVLAQYRVDDLKPFAEMPEVGTVYYFERPNGEVSSDEWFSDLTDIARFNSGNCYPTEAGAEAHGGYKRAVARRKLEIAYEEYIAEHGEIKGHYCVPVFADALGRWVSERWVVQSASVGHAFLSRHTSEHVVELGEKFGEEIKILWS